MCTFIFCFSDPITRNRFFFFFFFFFFFWLYRPAMDIGTKNMLHYMPTKLACPFDLLIMVFIGIPLLYKQVKDVQASNLLLHVERRIYFLPLRKHAYSNILKILPSKNKNFQIKNSDNFHISAQNIDCGYSLEPPRRGSSNEYPQSMFLSRNKKNNIYSCKPQFYYIKVSLRGSKLYRHVFVMYV